MKKNYLLSIIVLCSTMFLFAQSNTLCSAQVGFVKIENNIDIPTVFNNSDGTVTLTHPDQNITDIFSDYTIYDFYQSYPNSNPSGELFKWYSIVHGNKDLMVNLFNNVPSTTFFVDEFPFSSIDTDLIPLLHGKTFALKSICSDVPEVGETCEDNQVLFDNDFDLKITFSYDSNSDIMHVESFSPTPCENSFSIGLRGGYPDGTGTLENKVQLWESDLGIATASFFNETCHYVEELLYGLLDIGCFEGRNVGNLLIYEGANPGQIILERDTGFFSTDFMWFEEANLAVQEDVFEQVKPFKTPNNPYLQIVNPSDQILRVEIHNVTGQLILEERTFHKNNVLLSELPSGIYFIKLKTLQNQQKTFKFLNN